MLILLVGVGVVTGSMVSYGSYFRAFQAFFFNITIPYLLWSLAQSTIIYYAMALLTVIFIFAILPQVRTFNRILIEALRLRFENEKLVGDLRSEKQLVQLQKEAAERANQAKTRFLAHANHDLRQPIQTLSLDTATLTKSMKGVPLNKEASLAIGRIDAAAKSLAELLTSLLDLSRLDAKMVEVHETSFPITPLLQSICDEYQPEAEGRGIGLIFSPCPVYIYTDRVQLRRILANLVSNAIRYTDKGNVIVRCCVKADGYLNIEVRDTGRGIPLEKQELVFEEFQQLDNPERDRSKGLGLGLFIVRRLVELIKCDLELQSKPGEGSVFMITVPVAAEVPLAAPPAPETRAASPAVGLVLFVDDEVSIREAMRNLLSSWGYQVIVAGSGGEILSLIADPAYGNHPVLIICDYRLREGEGGCPGLC